MATDSSGAAPVAATAPPPERRREKKQRPRWLAHLLLIAFALLMLYPLLWMLSSSFKPTEDIFSETGLIPSRVTGGNYPDGWTALPRDFGTYIWNSMIVVVGSIVGNLLACSLAAYAFARLEFWGK